jgi:hypothetical protein
VTKSLRREAFRRGVLGSNRHWFALWAGIALARFVRSRIAKEPMVVERMVLRPGEIIEIRDTGIPKGAFPSA